MCVRRASPMATCLFAFLTGLTFSAPCRGAETTYDLVIRRGRIIDGTGNPWFYGDLAVRDGRIVDVGRVPPSETGEQIDARGMIVAPGFIDMHSHSDLLLLEDGAAQSKIRQGVTTEVLGEGDSAGPNQGLRSGPGESATGQGHRWTTLGAYFTSLQQSGIAVNVASYLGANNVWRSVMGDSFQRPTPQQLDEMKRLVAEAMQDGAMGLSSMLMMPPGSLATTDDLVELCRVVAQHGGIYSSHIRNEGTGVFKSVQEAIEIGDRAALPVDVIHLKIADRQYWGRMREVVALIEAARQRGINVQANVYPYTRGNNNLSSIIPPWAHEGGKAELLARLKDPQQRVRMKRDILDGIDGWYNHYSAVGGDWSRMLVSADNRFKGLTMDRVMALRTEGKPKPDLLDELFDLLVEEEGSVSTVYAHHTEEDMNQALLQPWCSIGSDGSAYATEGPLRRGNPHPRNFGTFPRVLGEYVRNRHLLTLEDAIRKMTSLNAAKIGLKDRGLLRPGMHADITIFDPAKIVDKSTYTEPFQYSEGIEYVFVNGKQVLEQGRHTGARPGQVLRHAQTTIAQSPPAPTAVDDWQAAGKNGAIVAGGAEAVQAGKAIMTAGGNAADGAAATILALSVTDSSQFCFGGEVPILVYDARHRAVEVICGQGAAPKLATREYFLRRNGIPAIGIEPAAVPGVLDACLTLLDRHGTRSFADVSAPALAILDRHKLPWHADLAGTLRRLAEAEQGAAGDRSCGLRLVSDYFYRGPLAKELADWCEANGGLIRADDLAKHQSRIETALSVDYRGYSVHKCGPWTQGPYLLEALRLLEGFDLKALGHNRPQTIHLTAEAIKLALADRDVYFADPLFVDVPVAELLSKSYADMRRPLIDVERASLVQRPGDPRASRALLDTDHARVGLGGPHHDTTTCVVADAAGNVVAATPSGWSGVLAGKTGVWLGTRLQSFNLWAGHPNCIEPGKRPRTTLTPTLVTKDGRPVLAISVAGGDIQDQTSLQLVLNYVDFGLDPAQSVSALRFATNHHVGSFRQKKPELGSLLLVDSTNPDILQNLTDRGHQVRLVKSRPSAPCALGIDPKTGRLQAAGDPVARRHATAW